MRSRRAKIVSFEAPGLVLGSRRDRFTIAYGEILTAERLAQPWRGLRLHVLTRPPVAVRCRGAKRQAVEDELRNRGVRVVDQYGAILAPTLKEFEEELARPPTALRQSSDDA